MDRAETIAEICSIHDELKQLGVRPEYINFARTSDEQMEQELEAVSDQLKRRKKFLGGNCG